MREEQVRLRQFQWNKLLDEVKVALGRMQYKQAIDLLTSTPWEAAEIPELAAEAKALLEEARKREQEATKKRPAFRPAAAPAPAKRPGVAEPALTVPTAKATPVALWVGIGVVVLALAGFGVWKFVLSGPGEPGFVQLTAAPWAEVVSVRTAGGEAVKITGQTPLYVSLPPGDYTIELKNGEATGTVTVTVQSGQTQAVNYAFPQVKVDALVDELVASY